jgi:hypothetical protein
MASSGAVTIQFVECVDFDATAMIGEAAIVAL